jgi:hypothetical protein
MSDLAKDLLRQAHSLRDFERRQSLSLRTPYDERYSALDKTSVDYFPRRLNSLSNDSLPERISNMDDTCWRLSETPRRVMAEKGLDTVKLESTTGQRASSTALGAISCAS